MPTPTDITAGTISISGTTVTGVGTGFAASDIRQGDLFIWIEGGDGFWSPIVASVESNTSLTLEEPWEGPAIAGARYRLRYQWDSSRVSAQSRQLIDTLGNGNVLALAGLEGPGVPVFDGPHSMTVRPESDFINGVAYNVQVDTLADRSAYDGQTAGFAVLVSDVGDGRSAVYSKASNTSGDWTDPAYVTGPVGPLPDVEATVVNSAPGTTPTVTETPITGGVRLDFTLPEASGFYNAGVYNIANAYTTDQVVRHNGSSFIALQAVPAGTSPSNAFPPVDTAYWQVLAAKGQDGTGTGDFVGPDGGVVDGELVAFSTATGKAGKGSGFFPQTSVNDANSNRLMRTGAFGLGTQTPISLTDINVALPSGTYRVTSTSATGLPDGTPGVLEVLSYSTTGGRQVFRSVVSPGRTWERVYTGSGFEPWSEIYSANTERVFPPWSSTSFAEANVMSALGAYKRQPRGVPIHKIHSDITFPGANAYIGAVMDGRGYICMIPFNATQTFLFNPYSNGSAFQNGASGAFAGTGSNKWLGGCLGKNNKIYGIPWDATTVLEWDRPIAPTSVGNQNPLATTTNFGLGLNGASKWYGGVLHPNGRIYCVPHSAASILIIDTNTSTATATLSAMGASLTGDLKWSGGCLAPNGKIYCAPRDANDILVIDPATNTAYRSTMGLSLSGEAKFVGVHLGVDGYLYCTPRRANGVIRIDWRNDTAEFLTWGFTAWPTETDRWYSGVSAADGRIYCIPREAKLFLVIDVVQQKITLEGFGRYWDTTEAQFGGGIAGPDGAIYCVPRYATSMASIQIGTKWDGQFALSGFINKF